jgi:uncharacterized protein (DUF1499 family)
MIGTIAALSLIGLAAARAAIPSLSPAPSTLGVVNGQLADCPGTANCVSSDASDAAFKVPAIPYQNSTAEAKAKLLDILFERPQMTLITNDATYIHVELRTRLFGFIDDTELYLDEEAKLIHIRSAARLGQDDMGVNRGFVEHIRERFTR